MMPHSRRRMRRFKMRRHRHKSVNNTNFVFEWTTDGASQSVQLPLRSTGTYNFSIDWGDGSNDTITAWDDAAKTHVYTVAGTYTCTLIGVCDGWSFGSAGVSTTIRDRLSLISNWGSLKLGQDFRHFEACSNFDCIASDSPVCNTTTLFNSFVRCFKLTQLGATWDTSSVTTLETTFQDCSIFNGAIDNWNVSNVTTLKGTFERCPLFNKQLDAWNVSSVTTLESTFRDATAFNGKIESWPLTSLTSLGRTFQDAASFNSDISGWDVSNVGTLFHTFNGATAFNQPIGAWNTVGMTAFTFPLIGTSFDHSLANWNVEGINGIGLANLLDSPLSTANYDATLISWAAQAVNSSVTLGVGASKYSPAAASARDFLVTTKSWTINDGGPI